MKVLAIRGCNIASLEGEFEIDFTAEPLSDTGIFVITGPTGAGKSTILDVLTVALYNDIPRFKNRKNITTDHDLASPNYNSVCSLLRRGTGSGYAEVDFLGKDGQQYRSRINIRRAREKADGQFQKIERRLYNLTKDTEEGGTSSVLLKKTEDKIGLSLDQFVRSILLPQGEFSYFLKSNDDERAEILEKLTGTDIYSEISKKVYQKTKEIANDCNNIRIRMGDIKLLTSSEIEDIEVRIKFLRKKILSEKSISKSIELLLGTLNSHKLILEEIASHRNKLKTSNETLDSLQEEKNILDMSDELSDLIREYRMIEEYKKELQEIIVSKENLEIKKAEINNLYINKKKDRDASNEDLIKFLSTENEFKELLKNIRSLEGQAKLHQSRIDDNNKLLSPILKDITSKSLSITSINESLLKDNAEKNVCANFLEKNNSRKKVVENIKVIISTLESCEGYKRNINDINKKLDNDKAKIEELSKQNIALTEELDKNKNIHIEISRNKDTLEKELLKNDVNLMKSKSESLINKKENLIFLIYSKGDFIRLNNDIKSLSTSLKNDELTVESNTKQLSEYNFELSTLKGKLDQQRTIVDDLTVASGKDIVELRNNLEEGKECPLCGSKHHPFSDKEEKVLSDVLTKMKDKYSVLEKEYNALNSSIIKISAENELSQNRINENKIKLNDLNSQMAELRNKVSKNELSKEIDIFSEEIFKSSLEELKISIEKDIRIISDQLTDINNKKNTIDSLNNKIAESVQRAGDLKLKLSINDTNIANLKNDIEGSEKSLTDNTNLLNLNLAQIDEDFSNSEWRKNWIENPELFVRKLTAFVSEWNNASNKIVELDSDISKNRARLELENQSLEKLKKDQAERCDLIKNEENNLNNVKNDINNISGGVSSDEFELKFNKKKKNLEEAHALKNEELNVISNELSTITGREKEIVLNIKNKENSITQTQSSLNKMIELRNQNQSVINVDIEKIRYISAITSDKINDIRNRYTTAKEIHLKTENDLLSSQRNLNDNISTYHLQCDNLINQQSLHGDELIVDFNIHELINEDNYAPLSDSENKIITLIESDESELNNNITLLRIDESNKKNQSELITELEKKEKIYAQWGQLDEVIGQADGKKFKKLAQEYTLDMLLVYANMQIANIAPRYRLKRIEDTLALQVIDKDMCDQLRSVHSLSGGETFLVSLALALALSSISSRNIRIESLFIDEGFGTLDTKTLHTVMDALEELYMQGRKVGIITHVKELTENIPVRIIVDKQRNGASTINIEG